MKNKILIFEKKIGIIEKSLDEQIEELMESHAKGFGDESYIPHYEHHPDCEKEERCIDYTNKKLLVKYNQEQWSKLISTRSTIKRVPIPHWIVLGFIADGKYKYKKNKYGYYMTEIKPVPEQHQKRIRELILDKYNFSNGYKVQEGWPFSITLIDKNKEEMEANIIFCEPSSTILSYYHHNKE